MFLLHLVLTGLIIGALAHDYNAYSGEQDHSREHYGHKQRKNKHLRLDNLDIIDDPFINWIRPKDKQKKVTSTTPDMSWLEEFLSRTNTESILPSTVETTDTPETSTNPTTPYVTLATHATSTQVIPDSWSSYLKRAIDILTVSVDNLSAVLRDVKTKNCQNIPKYTHTRLNRRKRDVANVKNNVSVDLKSAADTKNASTPAAGRESNDVTPSAPEIQNGRRSGTSFRSVKDKLQLYLDEGFQDIETKVNSLWKIKQQYTNVAPYKIGYIIANVDTLAVSIKNLKEEARRNRLLWEEREILDVYDRLKISNSLITNLMETLRLLMEDK